MFVEVLKAVTGFLALMAFWMGVQAVLRRRLAARGECDMLEHMVHGCGTCGQSGHCGGTGFQAKGNKHETRRI